MEGEGRGLTSTITSPTGLRPIAAMICVGDSRGDLEDTRAADIVSLDRAPGSPRACWSLHLRPAHGELSRAGAARCPVSSCPCTTTHMLTLTSRLVPVPSGKHRPAHQIPIAMAAETSKHAAFVSVQATLTSLAVDRIPDGRSSPP